MEKQRLGLVLVMTLMVASMEFHCSAATEHIVGDRFGWQVPSSESFYSWWAAHQSFKLNDVLVFNFEKGHTVAEVTRNASKSCDTTHPISLYRDSPARITINGDAYYICTKHCEKFMKFAINTVSDEANNSSSALHH